MLAAAGVTDPHDLVIWYWDEDAEPEACWVALPTVVDEAAGGKVERDQPRYPRGFAIGPATGITSPAGVGLCMRPV